MSRLSDLYRKIRYRIIALAILLSIFSTCVAPVSGLAADSMKVLGNGTVVIYEWKLVQSNNDLYNLYKSNDVRHCLFAYDPDGGENYSTYRYVSNYTDGDEWYTLACKDYPEIKVNSSRFVSTSDLMTPVLIGTEPKDPDWRYYVNGGKDYIYRFKVGQFTDDVSKRTAKLGDRECGNRVMKSWDGGSGWTIDNAYLPESWYKDPSNLDPTKAMQYMQYTAGSQFSIAMGDIFDSDGYRTTFGGNGWVKVWFTCAGWTTKDEGWVWKSGGNWVGCNSDKDWDDYDSFKMWIATPHTFSVIKQNYTIEEGQVVTIDGTKSHCMLYEGYTLTVKEGGVLNIKGKFINNGVINCDGGTIIMHDGASMFPYNTKDNTSNSSTTGPSALNINGGELILLSGATLAYDSSHCAAIKITDLTKRDGNGNITETRMGKVVNYGSILVYDLYMKNSAIYNKSSGKIALGINFEDGLSVGASATTVDTKNIIRNSAAYYSYYGSFYAPSDNSMSVINNEGVINIGVNSLPSTIKLMNKAVVKY